MFIIHSLESQLLRFMVVNNVTSHVQSSHGWYNLCLLERAVELINAKPTNCASFVKKILI